MVHGNAEVNVAEDAWDEAAFRRLQVRAENSNLDPSTLLATDYLNHFNEIVMLLEMVPDMPDILEDAKEWQPKTYEAHFQDSTIADKELAIEAFAHVPPEFKGPFLETISHANDLVGRAIRRLETDITNEQMGLLRENASMYSKNVQRLMDFASATIHGSTKTMEQKEIDELLGQ